MSILRLQNINGFFEMGLAIEENHTLQSYGDAYITIKVQSYGFAGHNDLWVTGDELALFCRSLFALEKSLRGEDALESIAPDELKLHIRSLSLCGHLAVEGETGYQIQGENGLSWHSVSSGIKFEPSQLTKAIKIPWLQRYASQRFQTDKSYTRAADGWLGLINKALNPLCF